MVRVEISNKVHVFEKDGVKYRPGDQLEVPENEVVSYIMKVLKPKVTLKPQAVAPKPAEKKEK